MKRWGFGNRGRANWEMQPINDKVLRLIDAVPGRKYRIVRIDAGYRLNSRLCAMGFIPDEIFYVSSASRGGPLSVVVKGTKFAIGRGMAKRIQIREI